MNTNASTADRYAVIGNPINHSKSPVIHAAFAAQTNQNIQYGRILGEANTFEDQVQDFFTTGGLGLNVTLPFKAAAWRMAAQSSPAAQFAAAANTLFLHANGALYADNTDGPGLIRDLTLNHKITLIGSTILLLGAGGAASGVLHSLLEQAPARLVIANRTLAKAVALAERINTTSTGVFDIHSPVKWRGLGGGVVQAQEFSALSGQSFDIIINATSAGISGQVPPLPDNCLTTGGIVYDMFYTDKPTPFVRWGLEHRAGLAIDGLGMLVEQAAESFKLWRGIRPNTLPVLRALRS